MNPPKKNLARKNWQRYRVLCAHCGSMFACSRPDARYCSNKCKLQAARIRAAAAKEAAKPQYQPPTPATIKKARALLDDAK